MNEIEFKNLIEQSWRRKLTPREGILLSDYLSSNAEARTQWEEEAGLSQLLGKLAETPVSTNFTARVLQAVERDATPAQREGFFQRPKFNWLPRIAMASAFVFAAIFSVQQYRSGQRTEMARDVAAVSQAANMPPQWLQDFDAINHLSQPPVDDELLAALK